jgi:hypothetical protein
MANVSVNGLPAFDGTIDFAGSSGGMGTISDVTATHTLGLAGLADSIDLALFTGTSTINLTALTGGTATETKPITIRGQIRGSVFA